MAVVGGVAVSNVRHYLQYAHTHTHTNVKVCQTLGKNIALLVI